MKPTKNIKDKEKRMERAQERVTQMGECDQNT
jgi:hypothetical protein